MPSPDPTLQYQSAAPQPRGLTHFIKSFFQIRPIASPGASVIAYVPFLLCARGLAFVRLLIVAKILGDLKQHEYGLYRPAQELINPLTALVMFGAADVAERYASYMEHKHGGAGLGHWLWKQYKQLGLFGAVAILVMCLGAPWISVAVWGERAVGLVAACSVTVLLLAIYQHLAAVLRGLRAYLTAAGMELLSGILLMIFSIIAAVIGRAEALVIGYALSIALPIAIYGLILRKHLRVTPAEPAVAESDEVKEPPAENSPPRMNRFAAWALVRLMLVMSFGFFSLWGVRYLAANDVHVIGSSGTPAQTIPATQDALRATADYAMAYTIAQLLAYIAVMLWASCYGIAARAWSHGQLRRAKVQLFRVGKFGGALMIMMAAVLLLTRGLFIAVMPHAYAGAIETILPGLLGMFIWYGLLAFASTYADLQEKPERGAMLWGAAVLIQLGGILSARFFAAGDIAANAGSPSDPRQTVMLVSALGVGVSLLLLAPVLVLRPFRFAATGVPLVVAALAPLALFTPAWVVDYMAPPVLLMALGFLVISGLLIRPVDRRALRRFLARLKQS